MAKGKHSTALFEVIHSANKPDRVAQSLRTPKWWFKSRVKSQATGPAPAPAFSESEPVEEAREEAVEESASRPRRERIERSSRVRLGFNRSRQELTFKLRYTTALVTAFGICVIVGLSYVVGRHLGGGPKTALADQPSVEQLRQQPPQPEVTRVSKPKTAQAASPRTATPQPNTEKSQGPALAHNAVPSRTNVSTSLIPPSADTTMPRKMGLNYLVINSYPSDRNQIAEAARDYFTKNGIPCTMEKTGWAPGPWITLIGTAGFQKVSSEDFKLYVERAAAIAKAYKTANFDKPLPSSQTVYSWRGTESSSN